MAKDNQPKNRNDASDNVDSSALLGLQLGQVQYSFFVDQVPNAVGNTQAPSVPVQSINSLTNKSVEQASAGESSWTHPSEETLLNEAIESSRIDPGVKYQKEFAEKCSQAAAEASTDNVVEQSDQLTIAGAAERQVTAGFSPRFNFIQSLERIFNGLDTNGDRRLSKDELDCAYADGRFTGDDELLLILLLRNLNDLRNRQGCSGDVTYQDVVSYPVWQQYLHQPVTAHVKKFLRPPKQSAQ